MNKLYTSNRADLREYRILNKHAPRTKIKNPGKRSQAICDKKVMQKAIMKKYLILTTKQFSNSSGIEETIIHYMC